MSTKKKGIILLAVLAVVLSLSYIWLGGFNEVIWEKEEQAAYLIIGKYYEGKYGDDFIRETFLEVKEKLTNGEWEGQLAVVYFNKPEENEGKVKNFIGAIVTDSLYDTHEFEYRLIRSQSSLKAVLQASRFVMPNPAAIYEKAYEKAREFGIELDNVFIEKYIANDHLEIVFMSK